MKGHRGRLRRMRAGGFDREAAIAALKAAKVPGAAGAARWRDETIKAKLEDIQNAEG